MSSQTGFDLFPDRAVIALRVNGVLADKATTVTETDAVEPVEIDSPDGLAILRHSTAHVLAQAVQRINPEAKLGIGPPTEQGFFYDFQRDEPFTPEDLTAVEKKMQPTPVAVKRTRGPASPVDPRLRLGRVPCALHGEARRGVVAGVVAWPEVDDQPSQVLVECD